MDIKASDVKALREKTGAGMMDCKKALVEAGGDAAKAEKILKELGLAAAAKRSGRATNEGRIFTRVGSERGGILEFACETDFVARNQDFINIGEDILSSVVEKNLSSTTEEIDAKVKHAQTQIRENIELRRFQVVDVAADEGIVDYVHGEGRIGVLVKVKAEKPEVLQDPKVQEFAFDTALHIAAYNPRYLSRDKVEQSYLQDQETIFKAQAANLGKPEKVVEGIVKGKLNKHLAEICLLDQPFVKDDKRSVSQVMNDIGKEVGSKLTLVDYVYYQVGEEI